MVEFSRPPSSSSAKAEASARELSPGAARPTFAPRKSPPLLAVRNTLERERQSQPSCADLRP